MSNRNFLGDKWLAFSDHLGYTRLCAPDKYPSEGITDLEQDFVRLHARWDALKRGLKRDVDKIPVIEQLLHEALDAYQAGDRRKGISAIKSIESMKPQKFR